MDHDRGDTLVTKSLLNGPTITTFIKVLSACGKQKINLRNADSTTPLMVAAELDMSEHVRALYRFGAKLNKRTNDDLEWDALMIAVKAGAVNSVRTLIQLGMNVDGRTKCGRTPLFLAIGRPRVMETLLKNGADPNACDNNCFTVLMEAVRLRCLESIRILLRHEVDVNQADCQGLNPLLLVILMGEETKKAFDILELLVDNGANVNTEMENGVWSALSMAVFLEMTNVVKFLIKMGADVNFLGRYALAPLWVSINNQDIKLAKLLIHENANIETLNHQGLTPLMKAIELGSLDLCQLLIDNGANVNHVVDEEKIDDLIDAICIHHGFKANDVASVFYYDPPHESLHPLHVAVKHGQLSIIKLLVDRGAKLDCQDMNDNTPLLVAVAYGHVATLEYLLNKGADPNVANRSGQTPLMLAAMVDRYEHRGLSTQGRSCIVFQF